MQEEQLRSPDLICVIRLLELKLENFKGIKHFDLRSNDGNIVVRGDNGAGKTTLADAFSWLLFGKDSQGRADFEIKTLSPNGEALHGLEHSVEALLSIRGGRLDLRKVYREKWTKRRGSAEKEFTGHTRDHFVNGVPVNQSEYEAQVAGIVTTEEISKLLTNPIHFAERLHWQERRRTLLEICGDISEADVIASSRDLADLPEILGDRSLDDQRKIVASRKRKINEELQRVPVRIDEVMRSLPEFQAADAGSLKKRLGKLRAERSAKEEQRSRIANGGEIAERTKQLREIESAILEEHNRYHEQANATTEKLRRDLNGAQIELDTATRKRSSAEVLIPQAEVETDSLEARMAELRDQWHEIDGEKFNPKPGDDACVACGQKLPEDRVEEVREKARASFNASKARRLEQIVEDGKLLRARCDALATDIEKHREALARGEILIGELRERVETLQAAQKEAVINDSPSDLEQELAKQKQEFEAEIESLKKGNAEALAAAEMKMSNLDKRIAEAESELSYIEQRRAGERRIEQLKSEQLRLAAEYEELERQLYLCEEFTRRKVSMLTDRINGRFELARFKLFDIQVNGAIAECCEVIYEGVPWSSLNTGAQVNIGLDMIKTFSEHYGIAPPIFVDHSESVTRLLDTPGQQIRLIVSEDYQTLHIEEVKR